jgi:GMP synthase (glutamine-hydrolysing)
LGAELITVDASDEFFGALHGVTDPEQKRKIVGEKFIRIFEEQAKEGWSAEVFGAGDDLSRRS